MKKLKKIKGANSLSKKEQQLIKGGKPQCYSTIDCLPGFYCENHVCKIIC